MGISNSLLLYTRMSETCDDVEVILHLGLQGQRPSLILGTSGVNKASVRVSEPTVLLKRATLSEIDTAFSTTTSSCTPATTPPSSLAQCNDTSNHDEAALQPSRFLLQLHQHLLEMQQARVLSKWSLSGLPVRVSFEVDASSGLSRLLSGALPCDFGSSSDGAEAMAPVEQTLADEPCATGAVAVGSPLSPSQCRQRVSEWITHLAAALYLNLALWRTADPAHLHSCLGLAQLLCHQSPRLPGQQGAETSTEGRAHPRAAGLTSLRIADSALHESDLLWFAEDFLDRCERSASAIRSAPVYSEKLFAPGEIPSVTAIPSDIAVRCFSNAWWGCDVKSIAFIGAKLSSAGLLKMLRTLLQTSTGESVTAVSAAGPLAATEQPTALVCRSLQCIDFSLSPKVSPLPSTWRAVDEFIHRVEARGAAVPELYFQSGCRVSGSAGPSTLLTRDDGNGVPRAALLAPDGVLSPDGFCEGRQRLDDSDKSTVARERKRCVVDNDCQKPAAFSLAPSHIAGSHSRELLSTLSPPLVDSHGYVSPPPVASLQPSPTTTCSSAVQGTALVDEQLHPSSTNTAEGVSITFTATSKPAIPVQSDVVPQRDTFCSAPLSSSVTPLNMSLAQPQPPPHNEPSPRHQPHQNAPVVLPQSTQQQRRSESIAIGTVSPPPKRCPIATLSNESLCKGLETTDSEGLGSTGKTVVHTGPKPSSKEERKQLCHGVWDSASHVVRLWVCAQESAGRCDVFADSWSNVFLPRVRELQEIVYRAPHSVTVRSDDIVEETLHSVAAGAAALRALTAALASLQEFFVEMMHGLLEGAMIYAFSSHNAELIESTRRQVSREEYVLTFSNWLAVNPSIVQLEELISDHQQQQKQQRTTSLASQSTAGVCAARKRDVPSLSSSSSAVSHEVQGFLWTPLADAVRALSPQSSSSTTTTTKAEDAARTASAAAGVSSSGWQRWVSTVSVRLLSGGGKSTSRATGDGNNDDDDLLWMPRSSAGMIEEDEGDDRDTSDRLRRCCAIVADVVVVAESVLTVLCNIESSLHRWNMIWIDRWASLLKRWLVEKEIGRRQSCRAQNRRSFAQLQQQRQQHPVVPPPATSTASPNRLPAALLSAQHADPAIGSRGRDERADESDHRLPLRGGCAHHSVSPSSRKLGVSSTGRAPGSLYAHVKAKVTTRRPLEDDSDDIVDAATTCNEHGNNPHKQLPTSPLTPRFINVPRGTAMSAQHLAPPSSSSTLLPVSYESASRGLPPSAGSAGAMKLEPSPSDENIEPHVRAAVPTPTPWRPMAATSLSSMVTVPRTRDAGTGVLGRNHHNNDRDGNVQHHPAAAAVAATAAVKVVPSQQLNDDASVGWVVPREVVHEQSTVGHSGWEVAAPVVCDRSTSCSSTNSYFRRASRRQATSGDAAPSATDESRARVSVTTNAGGTQGSAPHPRAYVAAQVARELIFHKATPAAASHHQQSSSNSSEQVLSEDVLRYILTRAPQALHQPPAASQAEKTLATRSATSTFSSMDREMSMGQSDERSSSTGTELSYFRSRCSSSRHSTSREPVPAAAVAGASTIFDADDVPYYI